MKESTFQIKLQNIIFYLQNLIEESNDDHSSFIKNHKPYEQMRKDFNRHALSRAQRLFYKLYVQCSLYRKKIILTCIQNQKQIKKFNRFAIATKLLEYVSIYQKEIVDQFYKIITIER